MSYGNGSTGVWSVVLLHMLRQECGQWSYCSLVPRPPHLGLLLAVRKRGEGLEGFYDVMHVADVPTQIFVTAFD